MEENRQFHLCVCSVCRPGGTERWALSSTSHTRQRRRPGPPGPPSASPSWWWSPAEPQPERWVFEELKALHLFPSLLDKPLLCQQLLKHILNHWSKTAKRKRKDAATLWHILYAKLCSFCFPRRLTSSNGWNSEILRCPNEEKNHMLIYAAADLQHCTALKCAVHPADWLCLCFAPYREDSLWVAFGPHVGVMDLLQDHPGLVVFPVLEREDLPTSEFATQGLTSRWRNSYTPLIITINNKKGTFFFTRSCSFFAVVKFQGLDKDAWMKLFRHLCFSVDTFCFFYFTFVQFLRSTFLRDMNATKKKWRRSNLQISALSSDHFIAMSFSRSAFKKKEKV